MAYLEFCRHMLVCCFAMLLIYFLFLQPFFNQHKKVITPSTKLSVLFYISCAVNLSKSFTVISPKMFILNELLFLFYVKEIAFCIKSFWGKLLLP